MSRRSSAIAVLAAVFFAGVATTLALLRVAERRGEPGFGPPPAAFWRGEQPRGRAIGSRDFPGGSSFTELARTRVTEHMTETLGLTDDQRSRIEDAFDRRRAAAEEAMNRVLPTLQTQMDSLNAEIEGILTEEQRESFRDYLRHDRERFRRRGGGPTRGRGGRTR